MQKILLTSFTTWLPHQKSNSADDLLGLVDRIPQLSSLNLCLLRKLPVNTTLAAQQVITAIEELQPQALICCGMAADRTHLTIETQAFSPQSNLTTAKPLTSTADLTQIMAELKTTTLSDEAGKFVCEGLYYEVLHYLQKSPIPCIFVHVPLLTPHNQPEILTDFTQILHNLSIQVQ